MANDQKISRLDVEGRNWRETIMPGKNRYEDEVNPYGLNSEDAKRLEMININGNAGVISEMEKSTLLYWAENGIEYHMHFVDIKGNIDPPDGDELIKMAESMIIG